MEKMTLTEAKAHFSAVIEKAIAGEETVVTKMGKAVAKIVPCESEAHTRRIGFMKGSAFKEQEDAWGEWPEDIARALYIIE